MLAPVGRRLTTQQDTRRGTLSPKNRDATHPDITFFGNVPYVSWIEARGSGFRGFVGHFENGVFKLDTAFGIVLSPRPHRAALIDFRVPISSSCTADPFTKDGSSCPVAAVNAPFDLFTTAGSPQRLFSQAVIGGLNCVLFSHCSLTVAVKGTGAVIGGGLAQSGSVGILVQRIVGTKRVHGKRVLVLRTVGRGAARTPPQGQAEASLEPQGERSPAQPGQVPDHAGGARQPPQRARRHQAGDDQDQALSRTGSAWRHG